MTSPPTFSFSKPAMSGDAVSVLVLVEDSATMAAKWPAVRDTYLPNLLENLRSDDPIVEMDSRWLATSSTSAGAVAHPIKHVAHARTPCGIPLGQGAPVQFTPAIITDAINILFSATRRQNTTRHLILVAASGPQAQSSLNDATPSGFDAWEEIAIFLKQHYIRLHVILSLGAEMKAYHELFKRSLQLQNNSEVPAWFPVDNSRYSIRLSGRPQSVRGPAALPIPLVPSAITEDPFSNPSPPASSPTPVSPPASTSSPGSPSNSTSPGVRKSSASPTTPRSRPRTSDQSQSPPTTESGNLVSYLQQMHGLTKKKSYGIKAPKKTYADMRLPNAGRPILPRLEVPQSQTEIYTYPSFDVPHGADMQTSSSDPRLAPPRRHSVDQLPAASVSRTSKEDSRARRRAGPWLPIAPLASSTPSSPTSTTSPGTRAAILTLESMTPRPPDFVNKDRFTPVGLADPRSGFPGNMSAAPILSNGAYYQGSSNSWGPQSVVTASNMSAAPSPTHTLSSASDMSRYRTSPPTPSLAGSDYTYGSSPPSSTAVTPLSLTASVGDSSEDQPFVVSPEYEASVNARFEEAVRSGAMQASMTSASAPANPSAPHMAQSQNYVSMAVDHQQYYSNMSHAPPAHAMVSHDGGYSMYHSEEMSIDPAMQANGGWQYEVVDSYTHAAPAYVHHQGAWYQS